MMDHELTKPAELQTRPSSTGLHSTQSSSPEQDYVQGHVAVAASPAKPSVPPQPRSSIALEEAIRTLQRGPGSEDEKLAQIHSLFALRARAAATAARARQRHCPKGVFPGEGVERGCEHYPRNCWIRAACCNRYYPCRRCHDENENHEIDRHATRQVACVVCGDDEQPVAESCRTCGIRFARYFCAKCKFYDDTPDKDIYHCDDCGICRVGKGLGIDNKHCKGCDACLPIDLKEHPCRERSMDANCPICRHHLGTSTDPVALLVCGHSMHVECLKHHLEVNHTCPLCSKALADMSEYYHQLDERLQQDVIPNEYANRVSQILCHDCGKKSVARFHFHFHKCRHCGVYNTRVLSQYDVSPDEMSAILNPKPPPGSSTSNELPSLLQQQQPAEIGSLASAHPERDAGSCTSASNVQTTEAKLLDVCCLESNVT